MEYIGIYSNADSDKHARTVRLPANNLEQALRQAGELDINSVRVMNHATMRPTGGPDMVARLLCLAGKWEVIGGAECSTDRCQHTGAACKASVVAQLYWACRAGQVAS